VETPVVYEEYQADRQGLFMGLTGPQIIALAISLGPVLVGINQKSILGITVGIVVFAVAMVVVVVPVRGRSMMGWLWASVCFGAGVMSRWTSWRSKATQGETTEQIDMPGVLQNIEVHEGPPTGPLAQRVAIIQNHATRTWAATAAVTHPGLALSDADERNRMGQGLTELLNSVGRAGVICELIFIIRTVPDDGAERREYLARHTDPNTHPALKLMVAELAASMTAVSVRTEAFVTVVVSDSALRKEAKEFGRGVEGRTRAMMMVLSGVELGLRTGMRMDDVRWLTSPQLRVVVRTGFAPGDRAGIIAARAAKETDPEVNADVSWPMAGPGSAELGARHYAHDAWWSCSDTIRLPGTGAVLGALAPVMMPQEKGERRCLMVAYPLMDAASANKKVRNAESTADMAEAFNEKLGRKVRAAEQRSMHRTRGLDTRLAEGHTLCRPYAVATVTVPKTMNIAEFGRRLDSAIRGAGFEPLRLDLAQDVALSASAIPLGISLKKGA
jgi:hypothetical protein